ncbi:hypothetical protein [Nocardia jiangxiensis]|uniref:Uncharacterized protein n=1 Tax=Nocardia jiangxiensis TaxID=282685 RepID=A0ABW6SHQ9_9NOCA
MRATAPESALWSNCSGSATRCVVTNSELKPVHVANAAVYRTVCGDVFVVVETVVDWNYRNLVGYPRQALRVSHLDVSCS